MTFDEVAAAAKAASCQFPRGALLRYDPIDRSVCKLRYSRPRFSRKRPCSSTARFPIRDGPTDLAARTHATRQLASCRYLEGFREAQGLGKNLMREKHARMRGRMALEDQDHL